MIMRITTKRFTASCDVCQRPLSRTRDGKTVPVVQKERLLLQLALLGRGWRILPTGSVLCPADAWTAGLTAQDVDLVPADVAATGLGKLAVSA